MKIICRDIDDIITFHSNGTMEISRSLGHQFITTSAVINAYGDVTHNTHKLIADKLLEYFDFSNDQLTQVLEIYRRHQKNLSFVDCTVIYSAIATNGMLISNEAILLNACTLFNIKSLTASEYSQNVKMNITA